MLQYWRPWFVMVLVVLTVVSVDVDIDEVVVEAVKVVVVVVGHKPHDEIHFFLSSASPDWLMYPYDSKQSKPFQERQREPKESR